VPESEIFFRESTPEEILERPVGLPQGSEQSLYGTYAAETGVRLSQQTRPTGIISPGSLPHPPGSRLFTYAKGIASTSARSLPIGKDTDAWHHIVLQGLRQQETATRCASPSCASGCVHWSRTAVPLSYIQGTGMGSCTPAKRRDMLLRRPRGSGLHASAGEDPWPHACRILPSYDLAPAAT